MADFLQTVAAFLTDHWVTLLVGLLILLIYRYSIAPFTVFKKLGIPGPTPFPYVGNTELRVILNPSETPKRHVELCKKYGKIFGIYVFRAPFLMVADPDMIKEILIKEFPKFHDRKLLADIPKPYDRMLTIVCGQKWKDIRSTLSPTFSASKMKQRFHCIWMTAVHSPNQLLAPTMFYMWIESSLVISSDNRNLLLRSITAWGHAMLTNPFKDRPIAHDSVNPLMLPFMNDALDTLLEKADRISKTGEIVDFHRWLQSLTMEVILSTAFGVKAETQTVENDPITEQAKKAMAPNLFVGLMLMLPFGSRLLKYLPDPFHFEEIGSVAAKIIYERTKSNGLNKAHKKDLLQLMLDTKDETAGEKIDNEDIQAQSLVFLLAGYETSSTTLGFVCYHLALDTHVQDKLRDEIDRMWPGNKDAPLYDILPKMEYLDMVINEALRMYPPGFVLQRDCNEACTIKGVDIPKGLPIMIPVYAIHHDPEIWPEPEKFDPERFTEAEKAKRHPYTFMPFGHGPRNCVGMRFAWLEIKLTLVKLLKKYKLERTEKTAVPVGFSVGSVLTCPQGNVMLRLSLRE